jgi:uncharacterized protein YktA (UPF0223 family)
MTNKYDIILKTMNYGYSKVDTFNNCNHSFLLQYILAKDSKPNFFGEFGSFIHEVIEKYFRKELSKEKLTQYYIDNYNKAVISSAPPYPINMSGNYFNDGISFFDNINFDIDDYNIISIEETMTFTYNDIEITMRPDIILQDKETEEYILMDLKTHKIKDKKDKAIIDGYLNQARLYSYGIWINKNIQISKVFIWFVRNRQIMESTVDSSKIMETMNWFEDLVNQIRKEEKWEANLTKKNDYFCNQICGVRDHCLPKQEQK